MDSCSEPIYRSHFEQLAKGLNNFIYYRCGDSDLAADLVQESFLRLWKDCAKVPPEKAKSFLFTVAANLVRDHHRHQQVVLKYKTIPQSTVNSETPQFQLEEQEFKDKLMTAIQSLPEGQREVFLMNRIDGMSYKDIAECLGVSVKAIEKRMSKALKTMREINARI